MALLDRLRPRPTSGDQDFLDECADMGSDRVAGYRLFEAYYDGEHATRLTDRTKRYLEVSGLPFCENFAEPVVDVAAERLIVTGFQNTNVEDGDDDVVALTLRDWWQRNRLDAVQGVVHTQTLMKGDGFLIGDWDPSTGRPSLAFNRPDMVKPYYATDRPDVLEYASKTWASDERHPALNPQGRPLVRLNVYWPDRVEKWFKLHRSEGAGGWQRWTDVTADGPGPWPTPWVTGEGAPLGVPVFHFRHKANGRTYGRSELRGVIPFQDELNKHVIDLAMVLDNHAEPQRWVSGIAADNVTYKSVAGNVWQTSAADAKFGQFESVNPEGLLRAIEGTLSRLARRSRTPLHLLVGGDMPSGEALKSAEAGLVAKVKAASVHFGNVWEDAFQFALRLAQEFGDGVTVPDDLILTTVWDDPESRNDREELETAALKHDLGVSRATLLAELGYDPVKEQQLRAGEREETMVAVEGFLNQGGEEAA